jgi:hypothetical protein
VSLVGPGGEGKPFRLLVNDDTPRVKEREPNDGFKQAMPITAPVVVEASFKQPQDVDVYRLDGKAGDKFRIEVQAHRYGSPAEPMLTLYDAGGHVITTGEPAPTGRTPSFGSRSPETALTSFRSSRGSTRAGRCSSTGWPSGASRKKWRGSAVAL